MIVLLAVSGEECLSAQRLQWRSLCCLMEVNDNEQMGSGFCQHNVFAINVFQDIQFFLYDLRLIFYVKQKEKGCSAPITNPVK